MKKINIILPYKETYNETNAGAVSILISQLSKFSLFKNNIRVYGSVKLNEPLTKNYSAIQINKPFYYIGRTEFYLRLIYNEIKNEKNSIIEIHNRPQAVFFFIKKKNNSRIILYFHNNPKELRGSKTMKERLFLLNNCEKIIFVSEWCKRKFFEDLIFKDKINCHTIYPGCNPIRKKQKKYNNIIFSGKLNKAKGYYIFLEAVSKFLNKKKNWKIIIIGDDPREYIKINHKNIIYTGWISHKDNLNYFKKSKIVVVPSLWEEPLGRTSIEAAANGCVTIITKRGGLPETNNGSLFLKHNTSEELLKILLKVSSDNKLINDLIKKNLNNFKLSLTKTINQIDNIYKSMLQ